MNRKAVFLDRDGVLNRAFVRSGKPYPPDTMEEFEILPGVGEALELIKSAGYLTVVVTNQPDVRTGKQTQETVERFHGRLRAELPIDDIRVCYHVNQDHCSCRKPKPGMLLAAAKDLGIACDQSMMVGDRWRDVMAGEAAGCRNYMIDYGYNEDFDIENCQYQKVADLLEAAQLITSLDRERSA